MFLQLNCVPMLKWGCPRGVMVKAMNWIVWVNWIAWNRNVFDN